MIDRHDPTVSVLIPVFNGEGFVADAISSVLAQSLADVEVIVIDDASQDDTVAIVTEAFTDEPRVRLIASQSNGGPGVARNKGLQAARGKWVAVLDADDGMESIRLESLIAEAEKTGLDAVADNLALVDPGLGEVVGQAFPLGENERLAISVERFLDHVRPGAWVNLGWMQPLMRRDFLVRHNIAWPDLRHAEDMVFMMRLLMAGAKVGLVGKAHYRYTQRRGTISGRASDMSRTKRSISEQQRAVDLIASDPFGQQLSRWSKVRLGRMRGEIAATSHALDLRDNLQNGHPLAAARSGTAALSDPFAFARCIIARYYFGARFR